jgi:DNA-binding protein HU-beta
MTKAELITRVAKRTGASQALTAQTIEGSLAEIRELLKRGDSISFSGFGSFAVGRRAKRRGSNPQTGGEMMIPSHKVVRFRPGKAMRGLVNGKK